MRVYAFDVNVGQVAGMGGGVNGRGLGTLMKKKVGISELHFGYPSQTRLEERVVGSRKYILGAENSQEEWRDSPSLGEGWQVSDAGRARTIWIAGRGKRELSTWLVVQLVDNGVGYKMVYARGKYHFIHRLVLEAFVEPRPLGADTRHLDDDRSNNTLGNLAWGTRRENIQDAIDNGRKRVGSRQYGAKLVEADVREIRRRHAVGNIMQKTLALEYGVDSSIVSEIISRKRWRHVL